MTDAEKMKNEMKKLIGDRAEMLPGGKAVFKLDCPFIYAGETFTELNLGPAMGVHVLAMDSEEGGLAATLAVAALMTGLPMTFFHELAASECLAISGVVNVLMGKPRSPTAK